MPAVPAFPQLYHLDAALTSGVDLLRGLGRMAGMTMLEIPGVTDGLDNDYAAQAEGALKALARHDLVVVHVEAPDEAGHAGSAEEKVEAIERVDRDMVGRVRAWGRDALRVLVMPDHPTPIEVKTHVGDPVPFLLWGPGFSPAQATAFSEAGAKSTGIIVEEGYTLLDKLIAGW